MLACLSTQFNKFSQKGILPVGCIPSLILAFTLALYHPESLITTSDLPNTYSWATKSLCLEHVKLVEVIKINFLYDVVLNHIIFLYVLCQQSRWISVWETSHSWIHLASKERNCQKNEGKVKCLGLYTLTRIHGWPCDLECCRLKMLKNFWECVRECTCALVMFY